MAKQLEALKSQRAEESTKSSASPSIPDFSDLSPIMDMDYSTRLTFDDSDLTDEIFELAGFVIDRETVVDVYHMYVSLAIGTLSTTDILFFFLCPGFLSTFIRTCRFLSRPTPLHLFNSPHPFFSGQSWLLS